MKNADLTPGILLLFRIEQIVETIKHPLEEPLHPVVLEVGPDKELELPQKVNDDFSERRPILFFIHGRISQLYF